MSRCLRTARVLQRYFDGELDDPTTIARVHAHLEECRRCGLNAAPGARAMAAAPSDPGEEFLGTFSIQQHLLKSPRHRSVRVIQRTRPPVLDPHGSA
ncbi:MAG: zf-HC2 domain-containing protein [Pseudonocardiales bacterium]|nr:zf-HC2 domain-containing protein [Pseudonocardiales bacterium]